MIWEKYKWFILGYVFYVSIVLASIWNERREFWPLFIIWCITIPIALYVISTFLVKYLKTRKGIIKVPEAIVCSPNQEVDDMVENKNIDSDIIKSWTLIDFSKLHGKMQVGDFRNSVTDETFKSCIFTDKEGNTIYVSFHPKMGTLTPQQIKDKKDVLKVGLLSTNKLVLYEN